MPDDDNVVSLDSRRRASARLNVPGKEIAGSAGGKPLPGKMIWLFCSTCKTLEYTEVPMPGGRTHNVCGTMVEEAVLDVDLRAEYTVAQINLERLSILENLLDGQRHRYQEYVNRLRFAAGGKLDGYPVNDETLQHLPVAEVDALGLLISHFFRAPAQHFPGAAEGAEEAQPGSIDPDESS